MVGVFINFLIAALVYLIVQFFPYNLHRSAELGLAWAVRLHLKFGADMNGIPRNRIATPLMIAARYGHAKVMEVLLQEGANVNAVNMFNSTALHYAVERGRLRCVKTLIEYGADVDIKSKYGDTALHEAARLKKDKVGIILAELLQAGADINAKDSKHSTPLHHAARSGNPDAVQFLIENGANLNEKDDHNMTALAEADARLRRIESELLYAPRFSLKTFRLNKKHSMMLEVIRMLRTHGGQY
ncbi:MAG TPA: ankyrin repeat domain-containing protein [Candidatus Hydrogenedentes bacterium]|nr:ankyrin repeat domain-containing protein [Candidatus Hydrogenedentota bacterium]